MMPASQLSARSFARGTSPGSNIRGASAGVLMPFDQAATFRLKGIPGNIIQDVINVSADSVFVAVSIGYGFEEDRSRKIELLQPNPPPPDFPPGAVSLSQIPSAALIDGFRLNPRFEQILFKPADPAERTARVSTARERIFSNRPVASAYGGDIIQRLKPAEEISFLFSIVDTATGRELQDEPTHNLASLGKSDGQRPFRKLAQPLTFQPRSTIRLQIVERSEGVEGTLFVVLYGFKIFGTAVGSGTHYGNVPGFPLYSSGDIPDDSARVIPFDYVASFQLTGLPENQIDDEVAINVEGGFVATSIGYGLAAEKRSVTINAQGPSISLNTLQLQQFPTSALQDGIRIRPNFVRIAFENNGSLATNLPIDLANRVFERLNRPEDVSFRYSIFDSGTGRELQNQPINNIGGLGIANGDRPFKLLSRPMLFLPRSTIRVTIEERFGRGTLFIVFQGYKILSSSHRNEMPAARRGAQIR